MAKGLSGCISYPLLHPVPTVHAATVPPITTHGAGVGIGWILAEYVKTLIGFFWQSAEGGKVRTVYVLAAVVKACFAAPMVSMINSSASSALLIILAVAATIASSWEDIEMTEEYQMRTRK